MPIVSISSKLELFYICNAPSNDPLRFDHSRPTVVFLHGLYVDSSWLRYQFEVGFPFCVMFCIEFTPFLSLPLLLGSSACWPLQSNRIRRTSLRTHKITHVSLSRFMGRRIWFGRRSRSVRNSKNSHIRYTNSIHSRCLSFCALIPWHGAISLSLSVTSYCGVCLTSPMSHRHQGVTPISHVCSLT